MKLAYIDQAIARRNYIQSLQRIRQRAQSESLTVTLGTDEDNAIFGQMSASVIRDAIVLECARLTAQYEQELRDMGVEI